MPVVAAELKLTVDVPGVNVPVGVNTVPLPVRLMVEPVPALKVALALTSILVAEIVGVASSKLKVKLVVVSPITKAPNVNEPPPPVQLLVPPIHEKVLPSGARKVVVPVVWLNVPLL